SVIAVRSHHVAGTIVLTGMRLVNHRRRIHFTGSGGSVMFGKGNAPDEVATPVRGKRNPKRDAVHFKQSIFANKLIDDKLYINTEYETFYNSSNGDRKADYETKLAAHYDADRKSVVEGKSRGHGREP